MPRLRSHTHAIVPRNVANRSPRSKDTTRTRAERIGERITVQPNGCWIYGDRRDDRIYRYVYETLVGPIPEGHGLHHECQTPTCCRPSHLTPMLQADHVVHHAELRRIT